MNVCKAQAELKRDPFPALLLLTPCPLAAIIDIIWLSAPTFAGVRILESTLFLPFMGAWGLQFAHQVSRMILAHVTKQPFPWWDSMWLWSVIGAFDANLPRLFGM